jgi:hypothetical protein
VERSVEMRNGWGRRMIATVFTVLGLLASVAGVAGDAQARPPDTDDGCYIVEGELYCPYWP